MASMFGMDDTQSAFKVGPGPETPLSQAINWAMQFAGVPDAARGAAAANLASQGNWQQALPLAGSAALALAPMALGIRAYHGSPYDFNAFDAGKIGTGEGAQAYGHGLYFAGNENVAKAYKENLNNRVYQTNSGYMSPGDLHDLLMETAKNTPLETQRGRQFTLHPDQQRAIANNIISGINDFGSIDEYAKDLDWGTAGAFGKAYQAAAQKAQDLGVKVNPGHMYEVNINADPAQFLDWDKPLSQQPQAIQQAVQPSAEPLTPQSLAEHFLNTAYAQQFPDAADVRRVKRILSAPDYPEELDDWAAKQNSTKSSAYNLVGPVGVPPMTNTGGQLYQRMGPPQDAAQTLSNLGIPGIKYLDQGSRTAGEGTSNYVVFDPNMIEILKKYGLMGPVVGAGGASMFGGGDQ